MQLTQEDLTKRTAEGGPEAAEGGWVRHARVLQPRVVQPAVAHTRNPREAKMHEFHVDPEFGCCTNVCRGLEPDRHWAAGAVQEMRRGSMKETPTELHRAYRPDRFAI